MYVKKDIKSDITPDFDIDKKIKSILNNMYNKIDELVKTATSLYMIKYHKTLKQLEGKGERIVQGWEGWQIFLMEGIPIFRAKILTDIHTELNPTKGGQRVLNNVKNVINYKLKYEFLI